MENPYKNEWETIRKLAGSIKETKDKISELENRASQLRGQMASLPVRRDEDGNDLNENARNAIAAQLAAVLQELSQQNSSLSAQKAQANKKAAEYRGKAADYQTKQGRTIRGAATLSSLSGRRFGTAAAGAAANLSKQRGAHYQSHVTELSKLQAAASAAAEGIWSGGGGEGAFADRGTLQNTKPIPSAGAGTQKQKTDAGDNLRSGGAQGKTGGASKNVSRTAAATMAALGVTGVAAASGGAVLTPFAHASVEAGTAPTQETLDAALARRMGITPQEAMQYRRENGLEWRRNPESGLIELLPSSVSQAFPDQGKAAEKGSAMEQLRAYMYQHNYSSAQFGEYARDPEWQKLHKAAFPDYQLPQKGKQAAFQDLNEYMCAHNYGRDDFAVYFRDPEWQRLHREAYPDYELPKTSRQEAYRDLFEYMCAHNYGKEDYDVYSRDPEWRRLYHLAYPDEPLPADSKEAAFRELSSYMYAHNYGQADYEVYSRDPTWQRLHKAAFPEHYHSSSPNLNGFKGVSIGKDLTDFVRNERRPIDLMTIAQMQNFTAKPRVVNERDFQSAAAQTGAICFRTWSDGRDILTGKETSAKQFKENLSFSDLFVYNGTGLQAYGPGIYFTMNNNVTPGSFPQKEALNAARDHSMKYGKGKIATACMTYDPSMRLINGEELRTEYKGLPRSERKKYKKGKIAAFAITKGYDAAIWPGAGGNCDYLTVYNRSKLIILDESQHAVIGSSAQGISSVTNRSVSTVATRKNAGGTRSNNKSTTVHNKIDVVDNSSQKCFVSNVVVEQDRLSRTRYFSKGYHFDKYRDFWENSSGYKLSLKNGKAITYVRAKDIEGVYLNDTEVLNPDGFWTRNGRDGWSRDRIMNKASLISEVKKKIDSGMTLEEIAADSRLKDTVDSYFYKPIEVVKVDDYYVFTGDGRHRIIAAQSIGIEIPVIIKGEYINQ